MDLYFYHLVQNIGKQLEKHPVLTGAVVVVESFDDIAASITTFFLQWAVVATNVLSALPVPSPLVKDDEEVCLIMNDRHHNRTSIIEITKPAGQS